MAVCEVCGNDYDKAFKVIAGGDEHTFDSFECAAYALAPRCDHCGCHILGHGVEANGSIFCCAHCAGAEGISGVVDRAEV
jgi:hypothetical protein